MANVKESYPYKSRFGSHASMISEHESARLPKDMVLCEDEHGLYVTEASQLDTGLADPYRHSLNARENLLYDYLPSVF